MGLGGVSKALKWLAKPIPLRARFRTITAQTLPPFLLATNKMFHFAYQPDSHADYDTYPEFNELFRRYTKQNKWASADMARLWTLVLNIKHVLANGIPGDFAELGVNRGNSAAVLAHYAKKAQRTVHLFDTFEGFDSRDLVGVDQHQQKQFQDTSLSIARDTIGSENLDACLFYPGYFPQTVTSEVASRTFCIVNLDCDLYAPTRAGLEFFYPRMAAGGMIFVHDYSNIGWPGVKSAVDEFCRSSGEHAIQIPDKCGSVIIAKSRGGDAVALGSSKGEPAPEPVVHAP